MHLLVTDTLKKAQQWHMNETQDLFAVSLRIQIAIDKMQLCSLSVAYACPYHNPTATMWQGEQTDRPHNTIHVGNS